MLGFPGDRWSYVDYEAKDLVRKLLEKDPERRLTAQESLRHNFFAKLRTSSESTQSETMIQRETIKSLTGYRKISKLKEAAVYLLVN